MENQDDKSFDFQLYSRQLVCDGINSFKKLIKLKILIYGMSGLGVEVAKNIILKGPEKVSIFDPRITEIKDMNSNFYLDESDIGIKRKDESVLKKLQLLNENVTVNYIDKNSIEEIIEIIPNNYDILVITEALPKKLSIKIDKICRENKIYFIYSAIFGLAGFLFNDFGEEHLITEEYIEDKSKFAIKNIVKNGDNGIVDVILPSKNSLIYDEIFVKFKDIKGMTELNFENEKKFRKIKKLKNNNHSFYIGDISNYTDYIEGGIVEEVIIPKTMKHKSLEERLEEPIEIQKNKDVINFGKINGCMYFNGDNFTKNSEVQLIFLSIKSLFEYLEENNRLPNLNSEEDSKIIIEKTKKQYDEIKQNKNPRYKDLKEFDEKIPKYISFLANTKIPCMTSFFGGIIAQEIIKTTGIYTPINQWLIIYFLEFLPSENLRMNHHKIPCNRYHDEIAIFGEKIINNLQNTKILLAGAGAVGCEMLKNLALLGIGDNKNEPYITVVDFDKVEISNLNRQFLFLRDSIGKTKVEAAAASIEKINKNIKILPIFEKFCKEKDIIFTHDFFKEKDIILISIDTISGKEYLDKKSILFDKPMILGAIKGPQAKSESYVPYETSCFTDLSSKRNKTSEEEETPSCTIRYFPRKIEDCSNWARNYFDELFINPIQKLKKIFNEEGYFESLKNDKNEYLTKETFLHLLEILNIIVSKDIHSIIKYGFIIFLLNFTLWSKKVFKEYPLEKKNEDGSPFWDENKFKPHSIEFDLNDKLCEIFIVYYTKYISIILEIPYKIDELLILIQKLSEKKNIEIYKEEIEDKIKKINNYDNFDFVREFEELYNNIKKDENLRKKIINFKLMNFQKDNDELGHIDFVYSLSNLRAKVYKIPNCDKIKAFSYIGKIAPSTITSTSTIVGFNMLQLIGLIINKYQKNKIIHNYLLDLSINSYILSNKYEMVYRKKNDFNNILKKKLYPIPKEFCCWDKLEIIGPKKISELIKFFNENYGVKIENISSFEDDEIYNEIMIKKNDPLYDKLVEEKKEEDKKLDKLVEDIYFKESGINKNDFKENFIYLTITAYINDNNYIVVTPPIKYIFN
jgi:ubiquitin-activating enzyme E1